ncbi:hypothetical protein [Halobaculum rarum]|uniref:hypothetical protein n=1 Tax=Halobaculum rarum TaxID=3075122 RepID=UPI0032AF787C
MSFQAYMTHVADPEWADLLDLFYKQNGWMYSYTKTSIYYEDLPEEHDLDEHIDWHEDKDNNPTNMLLTMGLIESKEPGELGVRRASQRESVLWYQLTEKGFSVAHDRYMNKQEQSLLKEQNNSNRLVAVFTILLAFTAVIQAISQIISLDEFRTAVATIYTALALTAMVISYETFPDLSI